MAEKRPTIIGGSVLGQRQTILGEGGGGGVAPTMKLSKVRFKTNPPRTAVDQTFAELRQKYAGTLKEREAFDWAADAATEYLSTEQDAWLPGPDGYGGLTIRDAAVEELKFRLGEQLPEMAAQLIDDPEREAEARRTARRASALAKRILQGEKK